MVSIVFWGLYFARFDSTSKMQTNYENILKKAGLPKTDFNFYDSNCITGGKFPDDADVQEIIDLRKDFQDACDNDMDCIKKGSRWSSIFLANGFVMFLATCGSELKHIFLYFTIEHFTFFKGSSTLGTGLHPQDGV